MKHKELDKYTDIAELRKFTESLLDTTIALQLEHQRTKDKLEHLEAITKEIKSPISVGSNEEELCKLEISRLYQAAKISPLEFQEIKAFEIYVKSLMLIKGKTEVTDPKKGKKQPEMSSEQLMQLALQVVDESNEQ
jgi:hypothetical protein